MHQNQVCCGLDLREYHLTAYRKAGKINLNWLMEIYKAYPVKEKFFDRSQSKQMSSPDALAGATLLKEQIIAGKTEPEIRKTWEPQLAADKVMRKKYTLYP